jgi:hypothetical protein
MIINLLLAGSMALFYVFLIQPAYAKFRDTNQELIAFQQKEELLRTLEKEIEERGHDLNRLETAFLDPHNAVGFITLLETIAARSNVALTIRSAAVSETKTAGRSSFDLLITGPLPAIFQYVTLTENMPYFTEITSLIISVQGGQLRGQLHLEVLTL